MQTLELTNFQCINHFFHHFMLRFSFRFMLYSFHRFPIRFFSCLIIDSFKYCKNCILVLIFLSTVGAAPAQPPQTPSIPQGLFSRLIEIKYTAELYLSNAMQESRPSQKDSVMAIYNTLRWKVDGLVYQLSGDLVAANNPRKMQLLNTWCEEQNKSVGNFGANQSKKYKSIVPYQLILGEIEAFYQKEIVSPMYTSSRNINLTTNVFYLLKDSYTLIKGISDMKTEKTMALIELLDHTRLLSPGEVLKAMK